eukprot:1136435-Pelagomonas_calceolata.AAC.10
MCAAVPMASTVKLSLLLACPSAARLLYHSWHDHFVPCTLLTKVPSPFALTRSYIAGPSNSIYIGASRLGEGSSPNGVTGLDSLGSGGRNAEGSTGMILGVDLSLGLFRHQQRKECRGESGVCYAAADVVQLLAAFVMQCMQRLLCSVCSMQRAVYAAADVLQQRTECGVENGCDAWLGLLRQRRENAREYGYESAVIGTHMLSLVGMTIDPLGSKHPYALIRRGMTPGYLGNGGGHGYDPALVYGQSMQRQVVDPNGLLDLHTVPAA